MPKNSSSMEKKHPLAQCLNKFIYLRGKVPNIRNLFTSKYDYTNVRIVFLAILTCNGLPIFIEGVLKTFSTKGNK